MSNQTENQHSRMVKALAKPGEEILDSLTPGLTHLLHMSSKLCSEAGELMDAVGKQCFYNKALDKENVTEELGDIEFYLEGLRQGLNITREQTLEHNLAKLAKRYKDYKYSDQQAQDRKDKSAS